MIPVGVRRVFQFAVIAIVLFGCVLGLHSWATERAIEGSYDQVFQATLETLERRGFPVDSVDREAGRIETGKRPVEAVEPYHPVETVRAEGRDGERVTVRLFLTFLEPRPSTPSRAS